MIYISLFFAILASGCFIDDSIMAGINKKQDRTESFTLLFLSAGLWTIFFYIKTN